MEATSGLHTPLVAFCALWFEIVLILLYLKIVSPLSLFAEAAAFFYCERGNGVTVPVMCLSDGSMG